MRVFNVKTWVPWMRSTVCVVQAVTERHSWASFALIFVAYLFLDIYYYAWNVAHWDVLWLSAWATAAVGAAIAQAIPRRMQHALERLVHRGALEPRDRSLPELVRDVEASGVRWVRGGGAVAAVAMLIAFVARGLLFFSGRHGSNAVAATVGPTRHQ